MSAEWKRKDIWSMSGNNFQVQVSRHSEPGDGYEGPHRWCVYAYIYPKHPHFCKFSGPDMWQDATDCLPMHAGPSLLRWHYDDDGKPMSVQVGADYNHLHDQEYTFFENQDDAQEVFNDAKRLFDTLQRMAEFVKPQEVEVTA